VRSGESSDSLVHAFSHMSIREDLSGSMESTESSDDPTASSNLTLRRSKLNEFLKVSGKTDLVFGQPKKAWENMNNRSRKVHVTRATNSIVAALEVISPKDAGNLWTAVQESRQVDQALGVKSYADEKYLSALAETYANATSWDTRRQVLAIMADLLTLNHIRHYIPCLTAYRFMIARKHIQKYGRGVPVPIARTPRLCRVDEKQLDHFLEFITSPHIVQDLPFGQRYLKLSNGRLLETPNVIRSMIPSRICAQYTQFCQESGVKTFSEKTMRRILSVCPATVRKSLQCLDYISAEGSKAFEDLAEVATKLEGIYGSEWVIKSVANLTRKAAPEDEKEEDGDGGEESDGDDDYDAEAGSAIGHTLLGWGFRLLAQV